MPWVKLDDRFPDHPKLLRLGDDYDACLSLHIRGLCYCAANLTDGFIPSRTFLGHEAVSAKLAEVGLWCACDGGYLIHDYLEYNPSREQAIETAAARSEAGKVGAEARWRGKSHNKSHGKVNGKIMPRPRTPTPSPKVSESETDSETSPLSLDGVPDSVQGYFEGKVGRPSTIPELRSLRSLVKNFGAGVTNTAIGQAVMQGHSADSFGLITTIAKAESA